MTAERPSEVPDLPQIPNYLDPRTGNLFLFLPKPFNGLDRVDWRTLTYRQIERLAATYKATPLQLAENIQDIVFTSSPLAKKIKEHLEEGLVQLGEITTIGIKEILSPVILDATDNLPIGEATKHVSIASGFRKADGQYIILAACFDRLHDSQPGLASVMTIFLNPIYSEKVLPSLVPFRKLYLDNYPHIQIGFNSQREIIVDIYHIKWDPTVFDKYIQILNNIITPIQNDPNPSIPLLQG